MQYKVVVKPKAKRQLRKISPEMSDSLQLQIDKLADNPRPQGYKKLSSGKYRLRKGDYRIVYDIHDHIITVTVIALGHRRDIYSG